MNSCWLQITSGRGPSECAYAVKRISEIVEKETRANGFSFSAIDAVADPWHGDALLSVLYSISGNGLEEFLKAWEGTIQWISPSPYRPNHRRKNWFLSINVLREPEEFTWSNSDFKIETMRSSGAGGQHMNKTESAIRVTHLLTGLQAIAREERSQHQNKKLAMARLNELLKQRKDSNQSEGKAKAWQSHNTLTRGNAKHVFIGAEFRRPK